MGNIVGIDLGTTFSAISILDDRGEPKIINIDGSNITASVVEFTSATSYIVGKEAKKMLPINPGNIAQEVKRSMGSKKVKYEFFSETHTPTSISALILKKLKEDTEKLTGSPIDSAVVTVPANFSNSAREATQAAADMAGLNVDFIINEPTAAALAYSFQSGKNLNGTFVIYDLGGGTFDCTIAKIKDQDIDILTSQGISKLGGKDFDLAISKLVSEKYKLQTGNDLDSQEFNSNDAEELKITLSSREKANARISGDVITVTKDEFNSAISSLLAQTEMAVETALSNVSLKSTDITDIILVGGSTRIPAVQESIKKLFKKDPVVFGNPDESVALGASIYAAYKSDSTKLNPLQKNAISKLRLSEAAPHFFGTISMSEDASGRLSKRNSIIIPKDETIPCSITESYYTMHDGQEAVTCTVTQCSIDETDPQFIDIVWEGELKVPGGRSAGQEIKVTFSYKEDGKMRAEFMDSESGNVEAIDLNITSDLSQSIDQIDIDKFKVE